MRAAAAAGGERDGRTVASLSSKQCVFLQPIMWTTYTTTILSHPSATHRFDLFPIIRDFISCDVAERKCQICTRMKETRNETPRDLLCFSRSLESGQMEPCGKPHSAVPQGKTPLPAAAVTPPNFLSTRHRIDLKANATRRGWDWKK